MLILPIKKKWFDMIRSGEKKEEYREIKPYYRKRFENNFQKFLKDFNNGKKAPIDEWLYTQIKFHLCVKFRNGYSAGSPAIICKCRLRIGKGKPEWGAERGKSYYILEILEVKEVC